MTTWASVSSTNSARTSLTPKLLTNRAQFFSTFVDLLAKHGSKQDSCLPSARRASSESNQIRTVRSHVHSRSFRGIS